MFLLRQHPHQFPSFDFDQIHKIEPRWTRSLYYKMTAPNLPTASGARVADRLMPPSQFLIRFELLHRTLIVPASTTDFDPHSLRKAIVHQLQQLPILPSSDDTSSLLAILQTHCRPTHLRITHWNPPFAECSLIHGIRGGKGGFGTLLKGQSRQSSAHTTKHFHDCRNLQGQRLRHVNEQLHRQLWQEWHDRVSAGTATKAEMLAALTNTATGIPGWHLQLPSWAEVSIKREQQNNQKLLRRWTQEQSRQKEQQQRQREQSEQQIASYVKAADQMNEQLERTMESALLQGLQKQKRQQEPAHKRMKVDTGVESTSISREGSVSAPPPLALVTISGEADVSDMVDETGWTILGVSNFCTVGILLDASKYRSELHSLNDTDVGSLLYYEVVLVSGSGVIQLGWAVQDDDAKSFQPNSDTGDGVGDCAASWGYDPSRSIKLHAGASESYGILDTNVSHADGIRGAVVGCGYIARTGEIFFSLNGHHLGTAFSVNDSGTAVLPALLYPVVSCDEGETFHIRVHANEMTYGPPSAVPVGTLLVEDAPNTDKDETAVALEDRKPKAVETVTQSSVANPSTVIPTLDCALVPAASTEMIEAAAVAALPEETEEPLDLMCYSSAQELEALGLERLKRELAAAGLKCGGSLSERAVRLFAIRGLTDPQDYPKKLLAPQVSATTKLKKPGPR